MRRMRILPAVPTRTSQNSALIVRQMRASASERATRSERAGEAARERACRGVRGATPLGGGKMNRREFIEALAVSGAAPLAAASQERSADTEKRTPKPLSITLLGTGTP